MEKTILNELHQYLLLYKALCGVSTTTTAELVLETVRKHSGRKIYSARNCQ